MSVAAVKPDEAAVHAGMEALGRRGCRYVVEAIARLERKEAVPELAALTAQQREAALAELKAVMAVCLTHLAIAGRRRRLRNKAISTKSHTVQAGRMRMSHLGKSGFRSSLDSTASIASLATVIPFS